MVQRLLLSWSRKELGDSEPFGLLLMLDKVSDLASLCEETNVQLLHRLSFTNIFFGEVIEQCYKLKLSLFFLKECDRNLLCSWHWMLKPVLHEDYGGSRVG